MSRVSKLFLLSSEGYDPYESQHGDLEDLIQRASGRINLWSLRIISMRGPDDHAVEWMAEKMDLWLDMAPKGEAVLVRTHGWQALWKHGYPQDFRPKFVGFPRRTLVEACMQDPHGPCWWLEVLPSGDVMLESPPALSYFAFADLYEGWAPMLIGDEMSIRKCEQRIASAYDDLTIEYGVLSSANIDAITVHSVLPKDHRVFWDLRPPRP